MIATVLPRVYLAGPVAGLTYENAMGWREYVTLKLSDVAECFSPMRAREHLQAVPIIQYDESDPNAIFGRKSITSRGRYDVQSCDLMLVNFIGFGDVVSKGTLVEIGMAYALHKPIVVAMGEGNIHDHPMVAECSSLVVRTLDAAVDLSRSFLSSLKVRQV